MDLLRAAIIGPSGTPYHDGLFFFDILLPPQYPHEPPVSFCTSLLFLYRVYASIINYDNSNCSFNVLDC